MDPTTLARSLVAFLTPFLPYLIKAGERAAEEASKKLGADAWEHAKALWGRLRSKPEVKSAAQDVAVMPDDPDAQAALCLQLRKLLAKDKALVAELTRLWEEAKVASVTIFAQDVVQQGKYNVNIGQAKGIAIGDQARVQIDETDEAE